jgi:hypothetical protein
VQVQHLHDRLGRRTGDQGAQLLAGDVDSLLRVVVPDVEAVDRVYKRLTAGVKLLDVSAQIVMNTVLRSTVPPVQYALQEPHQGSGADAPRRFSLAQRARCGSCRPRTRGRELRKAIESTPTGMFVMVPSAVGVHASGQAGTRPGGSFSIQPLVVQIRAWPGA